MKLLKMLLAGILLNSNIRCIEMQKTPRFFKTSAELNSNIRCIEII